MRRFVFRLRVLEKLKKTLEKQQKLQLAEIQKRLEAQLLELDRLLGEFSAKHEEFNYKMEAGMDVLSAQAFANYFDYLDDLIARQIELIEETKREKFMCQQELIKTMNELKVLEKLRQTQYQEYLVEVAKEQEKEIGDFVSYNVVTS